jgi:hypothetical protein
MRLKTAKCLTKCHNQKTFKNHMKNAMFLAYWLGNITRIQGFPSNLVERKAGRIYCLVSRRIPTEKSSRAHHSASEGATIWEDTFGVLERSSDQIQGNPFDPFYRNLVLSVRDPYNKILSMESLGRSCQQQLGRIPPGGSIRVQ